MDFAPLALLALFFIACALWWRERVRAQRLQRECEALRRQLQQQTPDG
ncbi:MAG: hypothetical protein ACLGI7_19155 [Gammaproteobacteria bacterium]